MSYKQLILLFAICVSTNITAAALPQLAEPVRPQSPKAEPPVTLGPPIVDPKRSPTASPAPATPTPQFCIFSTQFNGSEIKITTSENNIIPAILNGLQGQLPNVTFNCTNAAAGVTTCISTDGKCSVSVSKKFCGACGCTFTGSYSCKADNPGGGDGCAGINFGCNELSVVLKSGEFSIQDILKGPNGGSATFCYSPTDGVKMTGSCPVGSCGSATISWVPGTRPTGGFMTCCDKLGCKIGVDCDGKGVCVWLERKR